MARTGQADEAGRLHARVDVAGNGEASVATGVPVLDHLIGLVAQYGSFDIALEIAPGEAEAEIAAAGRALVEASGRPLVVSNVELSDARVAGLGRDVIGTFLHELAEGAGLTIHVRLIEGSDPEHVLEAIFKALGVALAQSCRPRRREEG